MVRVGRDNIAGETLPVKLVETIVARFCAKPEDAVAREDVGLLTLTVGVSNWGIDDPAGLPDDPEKKNWKSRTGPDAGKHLMAYSIGGVGISHGDVGDLREFMESLGKGTLLPEKQREELLRLTKVKYGKSGVVFDELRAAGVCAAEQFDTDLNGEAFKHLPQTATKAYCKARKNSALKASDWRLFRTTMRTALRTKDGQQWLARLWMDQYWKVSIGMVKPGAGAIEETMINARIRNSAPAVANKAIAKAGETPDERIAKELKAYGDWNANTLNRRRGIMMRPVVLYRHFAKKLAAAGQKCP